MVKPDLSQRRLRNCLGRLIAHANTTGIPIKKAITTMLLVILPLVLLLTLFHELPRLGTGSRLNSSLSEGLSPHESSDTERNIHSGVYSSDLERLSDETHSLRHPANQKTAMSTAFLHESNINASVLNLGFGEIRPFRPHGVAAHFFLQLGTYRSSPRAFSTAGSISRSFEDWFKPKFHCQWVGNDGKAVEAVEAKKIRPAQNFAGFYDSLVIICHFNEDVGTDGLGGKLYMSYWHEVDKYRTPETFLALAEAHSEYNASKFEPPFAYDVVYCGSPIYGDISPQRVREWLAYHAYVFGNRSHFILYDAGGFHDDVQRMLEPWVKLGRVTLQNIQQIEMYPAYYHHQHTVVNDCLMKSQFLANWTFFFDMDEYVYVEPPHSITKLLEQKSQQGVSVIRYTGKRMSTSMCSLPKANVDNATRDAINSKLWGFEKFVLHWHWEYGPRDPKYAVQARHMWAVEIHNAVLARWGKNRLLQYKDHIWFHHYHGFLINRAEGCRDFVNASKKFFAVGKSRYSGDYTIARLIKDIKQFEQATVGELPFII